MTTSSNLKPLPFSLLIEDDVDGDVSLLTLCARHGVSLNDLRAVNPQLEHVGCAQPLEVGLRVNFPPMVYVRQPAIGEQFRVGTMWERLTQVQRQLEALQMKTEPSLPPVPKRRVVSRTARLVHSIREESAVQLEKLRCEYGADFNVEAAHTGRSWKDLVVEDVIDVNPVVETMKRVEQEFTGCELTSLLPEHESTLSTPPVRVPTNALSDVRAHTVLDTSAPDGGVSAPEEATCPFHHRELHVSFYRPGSAVSLNDTWAVLPCQTLAALVDALECLHELMPFPKTRNRFMFIAGTFYIDDRHEHFSDLSEVIREFDPTAIHAKSRNGAYGNCPVKSLTTPIADIHIKLGEMCVYRHLGNCDHYFFFQDIGPLRLPRPRREYPRRIFFGVPKVTMCEMCDLLPATIATYGDRLAPKNPALYCPPCFRIFHVNEMGEEMNDGYLKFELPQGKHF